MKRASARKRPPLKSMLHVPRTQLVVMAILFLVIVVLVGYIWHSMKQWENVATHTDRTNDHVKARILALERKKHSLREVRVEIEVINKEIDDMCSVSPLVSWQRQVAPKVRDTLESCVTYQRSLNVARDALSVLSARASSEQRFAALLRAQHAEITKIAPEEIESSREAWRKFTETVEKFKVHPSLEDAKKSASTTGEQLAQLYDELNEANKKEDRAAYDEAVVDIQKAYSRLGEIQNLSVESYSRLVDKVRKTSQAL